MRFRSAEKKESAPEIGDDDQEGPSELLQNPVRSLGIKSNKFLESRKDVSLSDSLSDSSTW